MTFKECCFEAFTGASTARGARVRTVRATRGVGVLVVGTKYAWGVGSGGSRVARGTGTRGTGTRGVDTGGTGARGSGRGEEGREGGGGGGGGGRCVMLGVNFFSGVPRNK